jgi:hypothetical protein
MPNWGEVLQELQKETIGKLQDASAAQRAAQAAVDTIRRRYLNALHEHTGRNLIAYYSGFLSKPQLSSSVNDEDKNGFMMAVHELDKSKGLDLMIHTQGGDIAATQSIVDYLHRIFEGNIRAIIPQIAMSAGTMIACSCKAIVMGKHSNLGPIDPQIGNIAAYGVIEEFRRACEEVKLDPSRISMWQPIIAKYHPTLLSTCENAITWSNAFVKQQLQNVMFGADEGSEAKADAIVSNLSAYHENKTHARHIHIDECIALGLKIERLEDDEVLQDLVLTVHHCFMHSLMNTPSYKMIENHIGRAFVKQELMIMQQMPMQTPMIQPAQPMPMPIPQPQPLPVVPVQPQPAAPPQPAHPVVVPIPQPVQPPVVPPPESPEPAASPS